LSEFLADGSTTFRHIEVGELGNVELDVSKAHHYN